LSIKPFRRVLWIVLDGMGYEHAKLCLAADRSPALARVAAQGHLGPSAPSSPGCQTPSALYTLFSGEEPAASGIWGYKMPDPDDLEQTISGFHGRPPGFRTTWKSLDDAGRTSSVMNVAFRNDPVWAGRLRGIDFAYDGYRTWRWPQAVDLGRGTTHVVHQGLALSVTRTRDGVVIRKGSSLRVSLATGEGRVVRLSRGTEAWAALLSPGLLLLGPLARPLVRGSVSLPGATGPFLDFNGFRTCRGRRDVTVESEMLPTATAMQAKADLMVEAVRGTASSLVIGYFPLIDELNHIHAHSLAAGAAGRAADLFASCASLVDDLLARVMAEADDDTVVAISSDHGIVPQESELHLNEVLADEGLVRRTRGGYDLRASTAYFHPSDCGLVMAGRAAGGAGLATRIARALDRARDRYGVELAHTEEGLPPRAAAFVYPLGSAGITGSPPRRGAPVHNPKKKGGHHLSPLTPTPWIQALFGAWTPRPVADLKANAPRANRDVSRFLLGLLGEGL
jgi:hypothetical protein